MMTAAKLQLGGFQPFEDNIHVENAQIRKRTRMEILETQDKYVYICIVYQLMGFTSIRIETNWIKM